MIFTAEAILRRIASRGNDAFAIIIILSKRAVASRGLLACNVDIEPS